MSLAVLSLFVVETRNHDVPHRMTPHHETFERSADLTPSHAILWGCDRSHRCCRDSAFAGPIHNRIRKSSRPLAKKVPYRPLISAEKNSREPRV